MENAVATWAGAQYRDPTATQPTSPSEVKMCRADRKYLWTDTIKTLAPGFSVLKIYKVLTSTEIYIPLSPRAPTVNSSTPHALTETAPSPSLLFDIAL